MCKCTRYPAAYPLRSITTKSVVKALSHFISVFGIPKTIQTDRGTNFTSRMFAEILKQLGVAHQQSSAYHAQSQGALERFHQSLKALLRAYCTELSRDWEEGLPWLLMAAREVTQESTGFSPNELVFGHQVRGPLAVLKTNLESSDPPLNLFDYVNGFRRRLFLAGKLASENLKKAQRKMKKWFDQKAETRVFHPGDKVLALLPVQGSSFQAKFYGPYSVLRQVSAQDYVVSTPDRKKLTQLCHVNLLKPYFSRSLDEKMEVKAVASSVKVDVSCTAKLEEDVHTPDNAVFQPRLKNSEMLSNLQLLLGHLSAERSEQLKQSVLDFCSLFSDIPTQTHLVEHDIDVGDAQPIRQHFYRVPPEKSKFLESEVQYLLKNGLAKLSCSSWASPCVLVNKPDGTYRFCTDYRKLNSITKPDSYPLPRMEDCVDRVGNAKYVSKFDLLKGYYQVPLSARAQEVSSFITPFGLYSYTVMSFGLRNAPATFLKFLKQCSNV
ncbi:uncharacterized protein LOC106512230 [Austrofundulus limnaeus]|uniref:Uncharacterized protein LOC106512230 n=1 Tax=Austrofundulus limnaeus TaxID=52670 RepID=A0A2I4ALH5_AUSLI|nr:PREDICTED: uncharacterized protein LOC106512230 [Austrofundulus limnaeus]